MAVVNQDQFDFSAPSEGAVSPTVPGGARNAIINQSQFDFSKPKEKEIPAVLAPKKEKGAKPLTGLANKAAEFVAGMELGAEAKLPGMLKFAPPVARAVAGAIDKASEGGGWGDIAKNATTAVLNPKYSAVNALLHAAGRKIDTENQGIGDIATMVAGGLTGAGVPSAGATFMTRSLGPAVKQLAGDVITQAPGAALATAGALVGSPIGEKLAQNIDDPQMRAAAEGVLSTALGAAGGIGGASLASGIGKGIARVPNYIKEKLGSERMPTTLQTAQAEEFNNIMNTPEGRTLTKPETELNIPKVNANPEARMSEALGTTVAPMTDVEAARHLRSSYDKSQAAIQNAEQMYNRQYNEVGNRIGNNLITIDPELVRKNTELSQMSQKASSRELHNDLTELNDTLEKSQDQRIIAEMPSFKQSINWVKNNFLDPILTPMHKGEPVQLSFENTQKTLDALNSLDRSLNLVNLPGPIKAQLKGYRNILKSAVNQELESDKYPAGTKDLYKGADKLFSQTMKAKNISPFLQSGHGYMDEARIAQRQRDTEGHLLSGAPIAGLEHVTRTMEDVVHTLPEGPELVNANKAHLQDLYGSAQQLAAKSGKASEFNKNFLREREFLQPSENAPEHKQIKAPQFLKPSSEIALGRIPQAEHFVDEGKFDTSKFTDELFSDKSTNALKLVKAMHAHPERAEEFKPLLNSVVDNKVNSLFKQGSLAKGTETEKDLTNVFSKLNKAHENFKSEGLLDTLNPPTQRMLQDASRVNEILELGKGSRGFDTQLKKIVSEFGEKGPNTARKAATMLDALYAVGDKLKERGATLKTTNEKKPLLHNDILDLAFSRLLSGIKKLHAPTTEARMQELGNIEANMRSPGGREELAQRRSSQEDVLKAQKEYSKRNLLGALLGGGIGASQSGTKSKISSYAPYVETPEDKARRLRRESNAAAIGSMYR